MSVLPDAGGGGLGNLCDFIGTQFPAADMAAAESAVFPCMSSRSHRVAVGRWWHGGAGPVLETGLCLLSAGLRVPTLPYHFPGVSLLD